MCVTGGKRCEYSDTISNVRKKARSKLETAGVQYDIEREVNKAVSEFQEKNPELVMEHLPDSWGFEHDIETKEIPEAIKELLGEKKAPVTGCTEDEKGQFFQNLYDQNQSWKAKLTEQEYATLSGYSMYSYEYMNAHLRRKGLAKWAKENPMMIESYEGGLEEFVEVRIKPRLEKMDSAMAKTTEPSESKKRWFSKKTIEAVESEPQKLYRFFRVPPGVKPEEFVKKYFEPGSGFKDKGYLSTSADPEYIASHIMDNSKGKTNKNYIVLEMVSDRGGSLQPTPETNDSRIQSFEAEVLLPRGTTFQIVDTVKKKITFGKDRKDIEKKYRNSDGSIHDFSAGNGISVPIVRMVDTKLL